MPDHRPIAHLRPEHGWTNDPTGPILWQGRVHLFHQHNPAGGFWDRPQWGHLVTDDLVRWRRLLTALAPDPDGVDADGCFSGCVVIDEDGDGKPPAHTDRRDAHADHPDDDAERAAASADHADHADHPDDDAERAATSADHADHGDHANHPAEAVMVYTGVLGPAGAGQQQATCLARSSDALLERWTRDAANPVTVAPDDLDLRGFRDPFVWREDGMWWQLVGAGIEDVGGAVLLFRSPDLVDWEPLGPLLTSADLRDIAPDTWTGAMWECPALLRGPEGDALVLSLHDETTTHYPVAIIGRLDLPAGRADLPTDRPDLPTGRPDLPADRPDLPADRSDGPAGRFAARRIQRLDLGVDYYAPCLLADGDGRAISWAWSWEARTPMQQRADGWAGAITAPRVLELDGDRVTVAPLPALTGLRAEHLDVEVLPTPDGWRAGGVEGDALDLELDLGPACDTVALRIRRSPDLAEVTTIIIDRVHGQLWLDREHASLDPTARGGRVGGSLVQPGSGVSRGPGDGTDGEPGGGPVSTPLAGPLRHGQLRVLLDRSLVEVFVDDEVALTARIYPSREDSTGVEVVGAPAAVADVTLRAWTLGSIWEDAASR